MENINYQPLKDCYEGTRNCDNLEISEETKRLIKCRAMLNDMYSSICNIIHYSYGHEPEYLGELATLTYQYDTLLARIIGSYINDSLSETNFKSI